MHTVVIAVNERGYRVGETHQNAKISDLMVDQIRDRHEDEKCGYIQLSAEFGLALTTVRKICTYERRAQTPYAWKRVRID